MFKKKILSILYALLFTLKNIYRCIFLKFSIHLPFCNNYIKVCRLPRFLSKHLNIIIILNYKATMIFNSKLDAPTFNLNRRRNSVNTTKVKSQLNKAIDM